MVLLQSLFDLGFRCMGLGGRGAGAPALVSCAISASEHIAPTICLSRYKKSVLRVAGSLGGLTRITVNKYTSINVHGRAQHSGSGPGMQPTEHPPVEFNLFVHSCMRARMNACTQSLIHPSIESQCSVCDLRVCSGSKINQRSVCASRRVSANNGLTRRSRG